MIVQKRVHRGHGFHRRDMVFEKARYKRGELARKHFEVQVDEQDGQRFQVRCHVHVRPGRGVRSRAIPGNLHIARVAHQDRPRRDVAVHPLVTLEGIEELRRCERIVCHDQAKLGREQHGIVLGTLADRCQRLARDVLHDEPAIIFDLLDFFGCKHGRQVG